MLVLAALLILSLALACSNSDSALVAPATTPVVLVVTATPEPPLTPITSVAFTHTPVPTKAPPTPPPEPTYSSSLPYTPIPATTPIPANEQKAQERLVALNMEAMMTAQQPEFDWECEYKEVSNRKFYAVVYCDAVTEGYEASLTAIPPVQAALLRFFFTTDTELVRSRGIMDLGNGKGRFADCVLLEEYSCIEEDVPIYEGIALLLEFWDQYLSY